MKIKAEVFWFCPNCYSIIFEDDEEENPPLCKYCACKMHFAISFPQPENDDYDCEENDDEI